MLLCVGVFTVRSRERVIVCVPVMCVYVRACVLSSMQSAGLCVFRPCKSLCVIWVCVIV